MIIRQINVNESQQLADLLHGAYQSENQLGIHFAAVNVTTEVIQEHLRCNAAYILEQDGKFISTVSLRFPWGNNPGPFGVPHLGWFATHHDYKKQGLGLKLISWLEHQVLGNELKLPAVTLGTALNHTWLVNFYIKLGFKPIATAELGLGHTTLYLEKVLDDRRYHFWQKQRDKLITQGFELNDKHIQIERIAP